MSRSFARGIPWAELAGIIGLGGVVLVLSPGCAGESPLPGSGYRADASVGGGFSPPPGSCTAGSTMKCGVTLGVNGDRASCFEGVYECVDGHWSECRNGTETERPMPPAAGSTGTRVLSLSQATLCANNPCDPQCQQWIEIPDGAVNVAYEGSFPVIPDGGVEYPWRHGSYPTFAPGTGLNQPCTVASDCQHNMHCVSGICEAWYPGQTDPTCSSYDLAIGPTCTGGIPVCNHGQAYAPAGATVTVYPASEFKKSNPAGPKSSCVVPFGIGQGWCKMVQGCTAAQGDAIVVSAAAGECRTDENWSLYDGGACSAPICSSNAGDPTTKNVNLFFMVDQSKSMTCTSTCTDASPVVGSGVVPRWSAVSNALKTFLSDPNSAGIHVAFRLYPDGATGNCTGTSPSGGTCEVTACSTPAVEGDLASAIGTGSPCSSSPDPTECSIFAALSGVTPQGDNTPNSAALAGAVAWAKQGKLARPDEEFAVVLVTDNAADSCDTSITNIAAIAADGFANGVRTFVVGMDSAFTPASRCQQIATAGGGVQQCFTISASAGDTTTQAVAAFKSIASGSVSCSFDLGNPGAFDPSQAAMSYTAGTSSATPACRSDETEYSGHCYYLVNTDYSWSTARDICRSFGNGWDLASVADSNENAFLTTLVGANRAWLSGEDGSIEDTWNWADGTTFPKVSSSSPYATWTSNQPSGGTAENCLYLNGLNTPAGTWNDIDCPGATYDIRAVCEGPKLADTTTLACPTGQLAGPGNVCYLVDTTLRTWDQAVAHCQALGMDLANVTSAQQDLFIAKQVSSDAWINVRNYSGTWKLGDGTGIFTKSTTGCGPGETLSNGRCYKLSAAGTWTAAQSACQAIRAGFDLTKIESSSENAYVRTFAGTDAWISANDRGTEGTWRWSDNSQFFSGRQCRSDETALNGVCYHVETATPATWSAAKTACSDPNGRGGKLVEIGSSSKNADVKSLLGGVTNAWIGATDAATEGKWLWDSGAWFWTGSGAPGCQAGTKSYGGHCYTNNGGGTLRWSLAQSACRALTLSGVTWDLTTVSDDAENAWILANYPPSVATWIGANRAYCGSPCNSAAERWAAPYVGWSDSSPWGYTHWASGQPDSYVGCDFPPSTLETAAELLPSGYWNDDCDDANNKFPYVCEALAPGPVGGLYNNWATTPTAQPAAAAAGNDCAVIASSDGTWSDQDCTLAKPYVCEVTQGTSVGGAYVNWAATQPSGTPAAADCGVMATSDGKWSELDCTTPNRPGVCEGPLDPGAPVGSAYTQWASNEPIYNGEAARLLYSGEKGRWAGTPASATLASVCVGAPTTSSVPSVLSPVANAGACTTNGQFYYDNPADPTTLTLCPKACTAVQSDPHGRLNVDIQCKPTTTIPLPPGYPRPLTTEYTQNYVPTCDQSQTPVWQFFAYNTTTPSNSTIDFEVRFGNDAASLAAAPWINVATVSAAAGNEVCGMTSPCLVDLFAALGTPGNNALLLDLRMTLHPATSFEVPEVIDWRITHTCKDNQ